MNNAITVVIVCYNRIKYTKECIFSVLKNIRDIDNIIIIDNGSNDGSRRFISNVSKLHNNIKYYFMQDNLYVTGAWRYVANNIELNEYVLLLDNDALLTTSNDNLFKSCNKIFEQHKNLVSIGLFKTPIQGTYAKGIIDENYYQNRHVIDQTEFFFTDKYAGYRFDKSNVFKRIFGNWENKFIEEKYNQRLIENGYTTARIIPGFISDLSENKFNDPDHRSYYEEFWGKHKNNIEMLNILKDNSI